MRKVIEITKERFDELVMREAKYIYLEKMVSELRTEVEKLKAKKKSNIKDSSVFFDTKDVNPCPENKREEWCSKLNRI